MGRLESKNAKRLNGIEIDSTSPLDGYVLAYNSGSNKYIPVSGGGGGKVAIYDTDGVPTFYSSFATAFSAAVSGDTIHLMTSFTEIIASVLTIPFGVNINLNGNTLTIDQAAGNSFQTDNSLGYIGQITNGTIKRINGAGSIFIVNNSTADAQIDFTGLHTIYNGGTHFYSLRTDSQVKFRGLKCTGASNVLVYGQCGIENFTCTVTGGICFQQISNASKCLANATSGQCYNACTTNDCQGTTVSGNVYVNSSATRSSGLSTSGDIFNTSGCFHSVGLTSGGYALISGTSEHSKLTSTSLNATTGSRTSHCILRSDSAHVANMGNSSVVKFCEIISNWNSASALGVVMGTNCEVDFNTIKLANVSAFGIGGGGSTSSGGLNIVRGGAGVYSGGHTKLTTNTTDSQGNLLA